MPTKPRVRFAPSPTGFLHIGGARTALFNWLYARHTQGTFVLRIEDTDAARNTVEAVSVILDGLRWLGLTWDEGPHSADPAEGGRGKHGPYFQSQRHDLYLKRAEELIEKGWAYRHEGAIKFRMVREPVTVPDLVVGNVTRELTDRERLDPDFVIIRSDGQPVFHFTNVVDDLAMEITHVIRGEDHLANTAKHIALFQAFGVPPPLYAHIPLILNSDGSKMSKRDRGASLLSYREEGYAPEAVVNYLCLLGWSPKGNREVVPLREVIELFDLPQILRHNARFDFDKLHWMNGEYIKTMPLSRFVDLAVAALARAGVSVEGRSPDYLKAALATCQEKIKVFSEVTAFGSFYFQEHVPLDPTIFRSELGPIRPEDLGRLREELHALPQFTAATIAAALKELAAALKVKVGVLGHPLRLACTGSAIGPSLYHLLEVLGPDRVLARLDAAILLLEKGAS